MKMNKYNWISVEDSLPDICEDVWATNGSEVDIGFRSGLDNEKNHWIDFYFPVTHWMIYDTNNLPEWEKINDE